MARRRPVATPDEEVLDLAGERLGRDAPLLDRRLWVKYLPETDLLTVRFKESHQATRSDDDLARGLVFNYEGDELVSVEIFDLYGAYV